MWSWSALTPKFAKIFQKSRHLPAWVQHVVVGDKQTQTVWRKKNLHLAVFCRNSCCESQHRPKNLGANSIRILESIFLNHMIDTSYSVHMCAVIFNRNIHILSGVNLQHTNWSVTKTAINVSVPSGPIRLSLGLDRCIGLPILSANIILSYIYWYWRVCFTICADIKTVY